MNRIATDFVIKNILSTPTSSLTRLATTLPLWSALISLTCVFFYIYHTHDIRRDLPCNATASTSPFTVYGNGNLFLGWVNAWKMVSQSSWLNRCFLGQCCWLFTRKWTFDSRWAKAGRCK